MKTYMLIWIDPEQGQMAEFFDDYLTADYARMDIEVSLGYQCELYFRDYDPEFSDLPIGLAPKIYMPI